jgi:quercetin dioxygenase-like cupin family protein
VAEREPTAAASGADDTSVAPTLMPIEVRRFGVGHRRPDGPPGTMGVTGQVIHSDARGIISELAFRPNGRIEPHTNPNTAWFVVIEGGGWVVVDSERTRVAAGEAVLWPPGEPHGAWADHGHMRAFVIEFAGPDDALIRGIFEGRVPALEDGATPVARGEGSLVTSDRRPPPTDPTAGEPL